MRKLSKSALQRIQEGKLPLPTEDAIQSTIVAGLVAMGFVVLITSRRPKRCPKCGTWPRSGGGDGSSKGVGDLLVRRQCWPSGRWLALEVKRPGPIRYSSPEQKLLAEAGDVIVVQSLEQALAAARKAEAA